MADDNIETKEEPEMVADDGPPPLPEGNEPMMIEDSNAEKYGLKTGPKIKDTVKYKLIAYDFVMEDLKWGINSSFHFVKGVDGKERSWAATYPEGEEFLVVADVDDVYGEGWIMSTTPEGKEAMLDIVLAEERALQAIEQERIAAEAAAKAAEEAIRNAVYEEVDMLVKPYKSDTCDETSVEVDLFTESVDRPRLVHRLIRKRRYFGAPLQFADDDAEQSGVKEFRQHKDPNFELKMSVHDTGLQVGPVVRQNRSVETQTNQQRSVNRSTQYEPMSLDESRADAICQQPAFLEFIEEACFNCEEALQQNETIDVFQMELKPETGGGDDDDGPLGGQASENDVTKLRSLKHLIYSKEKAVPCIDWHPLKTGTIVACATDNISFNERSELAGTARKAYSLVWRMKDLDPYLVLESPFECTQIKYNPHNPRLIVGGLNTGQVVLWDTTKREEELEFERLNSHVNAGEDGASSGKDGAGGKDQKPLSVLDLSSIDASHNRPVQQLLWLPRGMEFTARGEVRSTASDGGDVSKAEINQFATIATDGRMHIWDIRFREAKAKRVKKAANGKAEIEEATWAPLCTVTVTGETGTAAIGVRQMLFPLVEGDVTKDKKELLCYFAADSGQLACLDVVKAAVANPNEDDRGVKWVRKDHFRPARCLVRSPFFNDIIVSVGDWDFNIWKEGFDTPLFTSTMSSTYLRSARWSPTRPGLLFVARFDGVIDVWDFADQSHRPATEIVVGLSPIDTMEFWTSHAGGVAEKRTVLLATTDLTGALHILQLSKQLTRPISNELALISSYFDRELSHREFVQERKAGRGASAAGGGGAAAADAANKAPDKTPLQEEEATEEAYKAIEEHFRELFGV
eukprot:INCI2787.1.p1 GENE.INCI2787.1~~INCI2787.1.p1  ORF type:complete len:859 (+),score=186.37 INCI2787.1:279-2855(+)